MTALPDGYVLEATLTRGGRQVHRARENRPGGRDVLVLTEPEGAGGAPPIPLEHPNLPEILAEPVEGGVRYRVLALPAGRRLDHLLAGGPLAEPQALAIAVQVAAALDCLHQLEPPFIMGRLSPRWVRMDDAGRVRLNFLAAEPGMADGGEPLDPAFAAPEALRGRPRPASDVYSLGALLAHMTGMQLPLRRRSGGTPTAEWIRQATAAAPARRLRSMGVLRAGLEQRQAQLVLRPSSEDRPAPRQRRAGAELFVDRIARSLPRLEGSRVPVLIMAVVVAVLAIVMAASLLAGPRESLRAFPAGIAAPPAAVAGPAGGAAPAQPDRPDGAAARQQDLEDETPPAAAAWAGPAEPAEPPAEPAMPPAEPAVLPAPALAADAPTADVSAADASGAAAAAAGRGVRVFVDGELAPDRVRVQRRGSLLVASLSDLARFLGATYGLAGDGVYIAGPLGRNLLNRDLFWDPSTGFWVRVDAPFIAFFGLRLESGDVSGLFFQRS